MFITRQTYLAILFLGVAACCHAQDSLLLRDLTFVKQQDAWLTSSNAAGLTQYASKSMAEAELSLSHSGGSLTDMRGSSNVLQAGARVESFYRISSRTMAYGAISYDNWTGRNMAGSAFLQRRLPFDIIEETDTNIGRKHRDTYQLTGAVGVDLWKGLSVGVRLDYTAANYAKYKDLRHSNKLMDLTLSLGLAAPVAKWLTVGAAYQYRRTTETVTFSTYGKEDRVYNSIIDFGVFTGKKELFGSTGYTDKSREMPMVENQNGGSVQLVVRPLPAMSFYNELSMACRVGYYGRKSPYTIVYTNHHSNMLTYQGRLSLRGTGNMHLLSVRAAVENMVNNRENYAELKNEAGASYYEYYADARTGNKRWNDVDVEYVLHLGIQNEQPTWTMTAGYHWQQRRQTAYQYPFYREQKLTANRFAAGVTRHIIMRQGIISASLLAAYQKGHGEPYADGTFVNPSDKQQQPASMDSYLYREYHLLTDGQYHIGGQLKYAFLFPATRLKTYAQLHMQYRKSNEYNHDDYTTVTFAIGCNF